MERRSFLASLAAPAVASLPSLDCDAVPDLFPGAAANDAPEEEDDSSPLSTAKRFTICEVYCPAKFDPKSLVDSISAEGYCEWDIGGDGLLRTRADALMECAGWNGDLLIEEPHMVGRCFRKWHVVVELGQRSKDSIAIVILGTDGRGRVQFQSDFHCRQVQPTAEERAAYPMPASKAGRSARGHA